MSIQAHTLQAHLAGEPHSRPAVARSAQNRCHLAAADKAKAARDALASYEGAAVGASAWFAFYVIAAATIAFGS
jgi:hypothetical protein